MNTTTSVNQVIASAFLQREENSQWSTVLLNQHQQLEREIINIERLMQRDLCYLLELDKPLKKLIRGLVIHLQLETFFLAPVLPASQLISQQKLSLIEGYKALQKTCQSMSEYIHAQKLAKGSQQLNIESRQHISCFLAEIGQRLDDETPVYSSLKQSQEVYAI